MITQKAIEDEYRAISRAMADLYERDDCPPAIGSKIEAFVMQVQVELRGEAVKEAVSKSLIGSPQRKEANTSAKSERPAPLWSADQVASHCGVTIKTVYDWVRLGRLRIGVEVYKPEGVKRVRFYSDKIQAWFQST